MILLLDEPVQSVRKLQPKLEILKKLDVEIPHVDKLEPQGVAILAFANLLTLTTWIDSELSTHDIGETVLLG